MKDILVARDRLLKSVRDFFSTAGYLEVETPNMTRVAPPDPYIEPLRVFAGTKGPFVLHTSPESGMKKLLPFSPRIYQICKTYRVEELDEVHNTEFTMLEWYMPGTYNDAMEELRRLVSHVSGDRDIPQARDLRETWMRYALDDLFVERTGINPLELDKGGLVAALRARGYRVSGSEAREDLFYLLYVQEVEPWLHDCGPVLVTDWPVWLSSMARKKDESRVERFEFYVNGLELANGYTELLNGEEQRERFVQDNKKRMIQGKPVFPLDVELLDALSHIGGPVAGVSVGLDRLLMVLLGKERIGEVLPFRVRV